MSSDPTNSAIKPPHHPGQLVPCKSCMAHLPRSYYGVSKFYKSGYQIFCKECHNQRSRITNKTRFRTKSFADDSVIRNVRMQNIKIISNLLTSPTGLEGLSVVAIGYTDHKDYQVKFNKHSVHIYHNDTLIFEMTNTVSTKPEILNSYIDMFKLLKLRLELNELQALLSKRTIFMWEGF